MPTLAPTDSPPPQRAADALRRVQAFRSVSFLGGPSPVGELAGLRKATGIAARVMIKRDDALPLAFGGNKVRKLDFVVAEALDAGADTLVTLGGIQSNHARATAAFAAKLGLRCLLIINGAPPERPTANALLDHLLGAEIEYIGSRAERAAAVQRAMDRLRREGRTPFLIPLGASMPRGALGFVAAVGELLTQMPAPDLIMHACSSGGTQAGLVAGCALHGLHTRVIGVSADDPSADIAATVASIVAGVGELASADASFAAQTPIVVDDTFVGAGYGIRTEASEEAQRLLARSEAIFVDHTYTAKALAALIAYGRDGRIRGGETVLFWHTGGQVGIFA